jgi:hypothetical protein
MQQDFHFAAVYVLCRCAGFGPREAQTVASASQYTDDCTFAGPVRQANGKEYRPVLTYTPGALALDRKAQERILRSFHFAGGADGIVLPGNPAVVRTAAKTAALTGTSASYGLHALGIALHALADSFAHQGFSAFIDPLNIVRELELIPKNEKLLQDIQGFFLQKWAARLLPLGHAEAGYCPDVPFLKWTYRLPGASAWAAAQNAGIRIRKGMVIRDNAAIAAAAAASLAGTLAHVPGLNAPRHAGDLAEFFSPTLFRRMNSLKGRSGQWMDLFFKDAFFDFRTSSDRACFSYDGKEWLGKAYGYAALPRGPAVMTLRNGYTRTDWWRFQQAARWYVRQAEGRI